jgi:hypothetical protein
MTDLTATELATRLGVTRRRALALLADNKISARRLANGTWLANADAVARFERTAQRGSGRTLSADAAWGLLWELSGLEVGWLSASTHARVRRRIREATGAEIATVVAARTSAHYFAAANAERASANLIQTGRTASEVLATLGADLITDRRRVSGYVRAGTVADYAVSNFMIAMADGSDVLFENTLPFEFAGDIMPSAVVAADLARSTDTRERAAGIQAIEELKKRWLAK